MKASVANEWVRELETGSWGKGIGFLHEKDKRTGDERYCCLGVLCEMGMRQGVEVEREGEDASGDPMLVRYHYGNHVIKGIAVLPEEIRVWAGMQTHNGRFVREDGQRTSLSEVNDISREWGPVMEHIRRYADVL